MRNISFLTIINFAALLCVGAYLFFFQPKNKSGYIMNQEVFKGFKGTQVLEKKLADLRAYHKQQLDSMEVMIGKNNNKAELISAYEDASQKYAQQQQELANKYTADIWVRINKHVSNYATEHDYDFIFGAMGDGSLMFGRKSSDVTPEIIKYINEKYEGD
jgi:outer membrane protein